MEIPKKYKPSEVENKIYDYWLKENYFDSTPNQAKAYTIVMPPPNVTGILHIGHMLNSTLQDVLIRRARQKGYNACLVPGTDHASIATEAKVRDQLKSQGISKGDITRKEFLEKSWEWSITHKKIIKSQLQKMGCSASWKHERFTMDEAHCKAVIQTFIKLYEKGLIYRAYRMINWDSEAKTTISDEEIIYEEQKGSLYHIKYQIENEKDFIIIATTRPETIFGDSALCIHPKDPRYQHLKNKKAIVPICNRVIPIIEDEYVEMEFGTGVLKITPAHDFNDKIIGEKHDLEIIEILNEEGSLNKKGLHYKGKNRFEARKEIIKELQVTHQIIKIEEHIHKVGKSERTGCVVEPRLSLQWFVKMEDLGSKALREVEENKILFHPEKFKNTYFHWLRNIKDWNISRQLYWGHQIPVYYYGKNQDDFVVAKSFDEALELAKEKSRNKNLKAESLIQESDVLDTWFSSGIWPISVLEGFEKQSKEFDYYYPTKVLVTGPDIIFFWVARMIMMGLEFKGQKPFESVYFTGIVRDKKGRKMSKSLGNSPDIMELIENYGADSLRMALMMCVNAGNDLLFDEELALNGRNFANKIWNAFRLIQSWKVNDEVFPNKSSQLATQWFENKFFKELKEIEALFENYKLSDALLKIYKLFWDDFCSLYLEFIKPKSGIISPEIHNKTLVFFENLLKILHPFMPFITEEIWQSLKKRSKKEALIISSWPKMKEHDSAFLEKFENTIALVSQIRNVRQTKGISKNEALELYAINIEKEVNFFEETLKNFSTISNIFFVKKKPTSLGSSFLINSKEYFIPLEISINKEAEIEKLKKEIDYQKGFLVSVKKKLSNPKFIASAKEAIIKNEQKKKSDALRKIQILEEQLKNLE